MSRPQRRRRTKQPTKLDVPDGVQEALRFVVMHLETIHAVATEQKVKPGALMPLLRASLSGQMRGPDVKLMMEILGQARVLERINRSRSRIGLPAA